MDQACCIWTIARQGANPHKSTTSEGCLYNLYFHFSPFCVIFNTFLHYTFSVHSSKNRSKTFVFYIFFLSFFIIILFSFSIMLHSIHCTHTHTNDAFYLCYVWRQCRHHIIIDNNICVLFHYYYHNSQHDCCINGATYKVADNDKQ